MSKVFTIIKKELVRIFTDKRMLASLILPGLLIFFVYSLMGDFTANSIKPNEDYEYRVVIFNEPARFDAMNKSENYKIVTDKSQTDLESSKNLLSENKIELIIFYEEDFLSKIGTTTIPNVSVYYNSTSVESSEIYSYYSQLLASQSMTVQFNFYVNSTDDVFDLATKEDTSAQIITMLVPFLLMIFLFSGCMAVSTESIAGEKERGTIATLLVTPVKRSYIALGKIIALAIASLVSSLSSFIGLILSIPKLMGEIEGITLNMYGVMTYIEIFILMMIMVLFYTVILSIISTFAKSVKEASQYALPVMVIVMMFSITSMMGTGASNVLLLYLIPVFNVVQCMSAIFSLSFNILPFIITIISNIAYIVVGIFMLAKMFNSEKIMFNK